MKRAITAVAVAAVLGLSIWFLVLCAAAIKAPDAKPLASATVYVQMNAKAHGSGVSIGHGYVLTAAHVADPSKAAGDEDVGPLDLKVIDSLGRTHGVEVMWANHAYDVALLHVTDAQDIASRSLSCRYLDTGESLSFVGNPLGLHDVTTYGRLAKAAIEPYGPWAAINTVSGQLIPGMSGGPTLDRFGNVVGINVGVAAEQRGFSNVAFDLSFIVPGRAICHLMDR